MGFTNFIAVRYLRADRQNRFFSWISVLSVVGIAIGVAAMIVVLSVINAFETELRQRFLAANAHVLIYRYPSGLKEYQKWIDQINTDFKSDVKAAAPFIYVETMAKYEGFMQSVMMRGIIPSEREKVQPLASLIEPKSALDIIEKYKVSKTSTEQVPPIIVGRGLMTLLNAEIGSEISLIAPHESSISSVSRFKIVGTYYSGLNHYDDKIAFAPLRAAQLFMNMGDIVTGLEVGLFKPMQSPQMAEKLEAKYPLSIKEWQSINRPIFEAMKMERNVIGIIVALVALVASFNILTTMFVAVTQKQRDISLLKALGSTNMRILTIFIKQGALIAVVGCLLGTVLAVALSETIKRYDIIKLPDIYLLARLPIEYDWRVYGMVVGISIFMAMIASLGPAIIAARVSPSQGFRSLELGT